MIERRLHVLRKSDYEHEIQLAKESIQALWDETERLVAIKTLYDNGVPWNHANAVIRNQLSWNQPKLIKQTAAEFVPAVETVYE
jgi:hypothetical protein